MCYPKPGPRCSAAAMKRLQKAHAAEQANPTPENTAAVRAAMDAWLRTPNGIAELRSYGDKASLDLADRYEAEREEKIAEYKALVAQAKAIIEQEGVQKATGRDGAVKYYKDGELLVGEDQHDQEDAVSDDTPEPVEAPVGFGPAGSGKTAVVEAAFQNEFGLPWAEDGEGAVRSAAAESQDGDFTHNVGGYAISRNYVDLSTGAGFQEVYSVKSRRLGSSDADGEEREYWVDCATYTRNAGEKSWDAYDSAAVPEGPFSNKEEALEALDRVSQAADSAYWIDWDSSAG